MRWRIFVAVAAVALLIAYTSEQSNDTQTSYDQTTKVFFEERQAALLDEFRSPEFARAFGGNRLRPGHPFARLIIPRLDVNLVVVEGITGDSLRAGAGHYPNSEYPGSANPGERGNVAIAGHRTGFGQPFRHLELLQTGDRAQLVTPTKRFTYVLAGPFDGHSNPWITGPHDFSVLAATDTPVLTITTTEPPHTSKNRLIARFKLVSG